MLSSATLQVIAIITMLIDHVGLFLFPGHAIFRVIGRISFPIFALLLVEGFKYTRSRSRYFYRLLFVAMVAQPIVYLLHIDAGLGISHNVLFSLGFALTTLMLAERGGYWLIGVPLVALLPSALECEYGVYGVLLILGFYYADRLFANKRILKIFAQYIVLIASMAMLISYNGWPVQLLATFAIIPIALYSGKAGRRLPKIFTYAFYPVHLLIILILRLILF